jgi:peptidoglycan/LPS O-acetylase OafA/YrhL
MFSFITKAPSAERTQPALAPLSAHARIDVCRGLFAFLVVAAHSVDVCRVLLPQAFEGLSLTANRWLTHTIEEGIHSVMGFFVLSGYCIHLSIDRMNASERFPLRTYLIARVSRILPLYYVALLFAVAVEYTVVYARPAYWQRGVSIQTFLAQLCVIQNFTETYGSFASSWSITNELFYYLFYGVIAWLVVGRRSRAAWVGMGVSLFLAGAFQAVYWHGARTPIVSSVGHLFGLGINWFLGALVAAHGTTLARSRTAQLVARSWLPLLAAIVVLRCLDRLPPQLLYLSSGVAFTLLLVRILGKDVGAPPRTERTWAERAAGWLGLASYPTYLFHGPLIILVASAIARGDLVIRNVVAVWFVLAGSAIACGFALGFLAERPIMEWRSRLLKRLRTADHAPRRSAARTMLEAPR